MTVWVGWDAERTTGPIHLLTRQHGIGYESLCGTFMLEHASPGFVTGIDDHEGGITQPDRGVPPGRKMCGSCRLSMGRWVKMIARLA